MESPLPGPGEPTRGQISFQTTHWSVVLTARHQDGRTAARDALASLCSTYWYPLYAFIRRHGFTHHEAEDLTQGFFCRFLERDSLKKVTPAAGKFRSFLLVCLKHFLANEREWAHAQRRGGGHVPIPLEGGKAETQYLLEPADPVTPEVLFDRRWAFTVLEQTLARIEGDYHRRGQGGLFDSLKGFLPGRDVSVARPEVAARLGMSVGGLDVAIHRLRQRFGALLREEVAQTVSSEEDLEDEVHYLIAVLGQ
jgi:DNA-directed RNA polymerase specialized sigma24 family protein